MRPTAVFTVVMPSARTWWLCAGYDNHPEEVVDTLLDTLDDPALALVQWQEQYGIVQVWLMRSCPTSTSLEQLKHSHTFT